MPKQTLLFYDTETTGLNPCFDQVLQFAAIRTDLNLQELERYNIQVKLNCDVIPSPYALITHRIGIQQSQQGQSEATAIEKIHDLLNTPGTISLGYNTLGFDDEFLRFSFYRNLLAPYTHQYANHCYRMDLYPATVMYYLYKPNILTWPEGNLKLENISKLNSLATGQAHDAMVDVEATLALAKAMMKEKDMWDYVCGYFQKQTDLARINQLDIAFESPQGIFREAILVSGKFGFKAHFQAPVISLGQHLHYKNQTLWLRLDQQKLQQTTSTNIDKNTFVMRKKVGENQLLLPTLPRFLKHMDPERLALAKENQAWLQKNPQICREICEYHQHFKYTPVANIDIDAALYDIGFPSRREEILFQQFHAASGEEKVAIAKQLPNKKRYEQAIRVLGRHYPQLLKDKDLAMFQEYLMRDQGIDYRGATKMTVATALDQIKALPSERKLDDEQIKLLDEYQQWLTAKSAEPIIN